VVAPTEPDLNELGPNASDPNEPLRNVPTRRELGLNARVRNAHPVWWPDVPSVAPSTWPPLEPVCRDDPLLDPLHPFLIRDSWGHLGDMGSN
jgi:hypothetical protein